VGKTSKAPDQPIEIVVKSDGRLLLRDRTAGPAAPVELRLEDLGGVMEQKLARNADTPVVISGDKNVRYESVTKVMDALYKLHVRRVGLAVKPAA
jgi:biopolymer transport protein TolR